MVQEGLRSLMMPNKENIMSLIEGLPIEKDTVMSYGVSLFISELDPEEVTMKWYENGWSLQVKTDKDNTEKMKEFWEENIEEKL